jgi:putative Mg2+ transporter-C (MgtC) family protein
MISDTFASVIAGAYWSNATVAFNLQALFNIIFALLLGMIVGFERSYHGRAAGIRTYGMVCMASCAIVAITAHPEAWFGGSGMHSGALDPTRVIQGITTGIGFLGAGIIHREGFKTNGLTTAASLWASSSIGIMVGVGFYAAAVLLSILCITCMTFVSAIERYLPSRSELFIKMRFHSKEPSLELLRRAAHRSGYVISENTVSIAFANGMPEWSFIIVSQGKHAAHMSEIAKLLTDYEGVATFEMANVRN